LPTPAAATGENPRDPQASSLRQSPAAPRLRKVLKWSAVLGWAFAVGAGLQIIWTYGVTPGETSPAPAQWPGSPLIAPSGKDPTLLMFVHPRCTCTRSSLANLREIVRRTNETPAVWILLLNFDASDADWLRTDTVARARQIPGARVVHDVAGQEAARFGVATSGHVVLYDASGRLRFSGGITAARAQAGDNDGQRSVLSFLADAQADARHEHATFGCSFHDPRAAAP